MQLRHLPVLAALWVTPLTALAADNIDIRALRDELARLRETYEKRIDALEQRLVQAEATAAAADARAASVAAAPPPVPLPAAPPSGANAFNPGIALVLSGAYANHSRDPAGYRITGFHLPNDALDEIKPQRGFSLGESELGISANIDPLFFGQMFFAVHPDDAVSAEEAFIQTTSLPHGFMLKAGRWLSGIGYLNEQHAHVWDFADAPLAYQAFLGGQFNNDGAQLRWLAPSETFIELGAELGRGSAYPGTGRDKNGSGASALFAHIGGDVGDSNSWRAGLSYLTTSPRDRQWDDIDAFGAPVSNGFSGRSRLWIADGVWRWAPNGNPAIRNFKLQGEYLRRSEDGTVSYNLAAPGAYAATQSGWYLQGVYQFAPYWRFGVRTERLSSGRVDYGANNISLLRPGHAPQRNALMVDYSPSEFSRMRFQLGQDKSREGVTDNQFVVQYQMSLGAHGAHKF